MKNLKIIIAAILLFPTFSYAQLYKSESSYIRFYSEAPTENIEGITEKATGALRISDQMLVISIPIKSFQFEKSLMQEHFNENYLESDKYKSATFKGKINEKLNWGKDGEYDGTATGILHIHGVDQKVTIKGKIVIKKGKIYFDSKFNIALEDYKIDIPKVVILNIAEVVEVTMKMAFSLAPKK